MDKANKYICSLLKESIADERAAPSMYANVIESMKSDNLLSDEETEYIRSIINDEERHEKFFVKLAEEHGCQISTKKETPKTFADLPLVERIRLAKGTIKKMEEEYGK